MIDSEGETAGNSSQAKGGAGQPSPPSGSPGASTMRLAVNLSTQEALIQIHTDASKLTAFLTLKALAESAKLEPDAIMSRVMESGLLFVEDDLVQTRQLVVQFCSSRTLVESAVITRGLEPLPGENGKIEWAIEYVEKKTIDEDSRIDFREKETIRNVKKGEKLLTIVPPEKGLPGRDVFGHDIPCKSGKPVIVSRGSNVRVEDKGASFFADTDGRVSLDRNILRVDPVIEVKEDVDFSVGNIDFSGVVLVHGNIQDGFIVKASRGLTVDGMIDAATLESASDIFIKGGMAGRGKGSIRCGGKLVAKYLNQVNVQVSGNLTVSAEINNCVVNCLGNITLFRGSIIGGEITALGSINAPVIGSPMGVKTVVAAGVNFSTASQLREARAAIQSSDASIRKINERIMPFLQSKELLASLSPRKLEIVRDLLLELEKEQQSLLELQAQEQELAKIQQSQMKKVIMVGRRLYGGVEIILGDCRMSNTDDLEGPLKLTPNEADGTVKIRGIDK